MMTPIRTTTVEKPEGSMAQLLTMLNHHDDKVSVNVESFVLHEDTTEDIEGWAARTLLVFYVNDNEHSKLFGLQKDSLASDSEARVVADKQHAHLVDGWERETLIKTDAYQYLVNTFVLED